MQSSRGVRLLGQEGFEDFASDLLHGALGSRDHTQCFTLGGLVVLNGTTFSEGPGSRHVAS